MGHNHFHVNTWKSIESRYNFACNLIDQMSNQMNIIQIDESSFNANTVNNRVWISDFRRLSRFTVSVSVFLIADIIQTGNYQYAISVGGNYQEVYLKFLKQLMSRMLEKQPAFRESVYSQLNEQNSIRPNLFISSSPARTSGT